MGITVDPAVLDTAGSDTISASSAFTAAVGAALAALGDTGGMTGTDPAGLVVGESYDDAASGAVEAIVDVANGSTRIGDLLRMSAYNYAIANHYSSITPGGGPPTKPEATTPYSAQLPPKGEGSLSDAPFGWGLIQSVIGMIWPNGHPDTMRAAATSWQAVTTAAQTFDGALLTPESNAKSQDIPEKDHIATAFSDAVDALTQLEAAATGIAVQLNGYAQHVDDAHTHLLRLVGEVLHLATPSGLFGEFVSIIKGGEDQLRAIAHEAKQVLEDLKVEADAVGILLQPLLAAAKQAAKTMAAWAQIALDTVADVVQVAAADVVNAVASLGNAALHNPLDVVGMAAGAALMVAGAGIEIPGIALDATGVGAVVGVPVNVAGVAMIATGATMAGAGALDLAHDAATEHGVVVMEARTSGSFRPGHSGYGRDAERRGIENYRRDHPGRWVTTRKKAVKVVNSEGREVRTFPDGLARKPDGTYEAVEVKSGTAGLTPNQATLQAQLGRGEPAYVTITTENGAVETVKITSFRVEPVPSEGPRG